MDFSEPLDPLASAASFADFTEDDLKSLGIEMPTDFDNAILDEWVDEDLDLLFPDYAMDGIETTTSERAVVVDSPDPTDFTETRLQTSLPESMNNSQIRSVVSATTNGIPEQNMPLVDVRDEATRTRRRINCAQWDDKRRLITSLYIDQGNSLSQTRRIMADDHGFYASEKAYKDKIREWRLVKNLKKRQIIYMLKIARKRRDEQGKATTFFYHGNRVPETKMRRYSNAMTTTSTIGTVLSNITYVTTTDAQIPNIQYQQRSSRQSQAQTSSTVPDSLSPPLSSQAAYGLDKDCPAFLNLKRIIIEAFEAKDDDDELIERCGSNVSTALEHLRIFHLEKTGSTPTPIAELAKFCLSPSFVQEMPVIRDFWYSVDRRLFAMPLQIWQAQCLIAARRFSEGEVLLDMVLLEYEQIGFTSGAARLKKISPLIMLFAKAYLAQQKFYTLEEMLQSAIRSMGELDDIYAGELAGENLSLWRMLYVCRYFQLKALNNSAEPRNGLFTSWKDFYKSDATLAKNWVGFEDENSEHNNLLWALGILDVLRYVSDCRLPLYLVRLESVLRCMRDVALSRPIAALIDRAVSAGDRRTSEDADVSQMCSIFSRMLDSYRDVGTLDEIVNWESFLQSHNLIYTPPDATLENLSEFDYAIRVMGPSFKRFLEGWPSIELPDISEARRTSFPFPPSQFC